MRIKKIAPISNQMFRGWSLNKYGVRKNIWTSWQEHTVHIMTFVCPKTRFWRYSMTFLKEMYLWNLHLWSILSEPANTSATLTRLARTHHTGGVSSGWANAMERIQEGFYREQPGPAVQRESLCQSCRFLSTGHKPYVLGQHQALYLTFLFTDTKMLSLFQLLSQ